MNQEPPATTIWAKLIALTPSNQDISLTFDQNKDLFDNKLTICQNEDGHAFIKNLSASCLALDNNILEIDQEKRLFGGERLSLKQDEETTDHVFCFVSLKGKRDGQGLQSDLQNELMCSICHYLLEKCVSVTPCQHAFCSSCLFNHIKWSSRCPLCKGEIAFVAKNPVLSNIVQLVTDHFSILQISQKRKELEHVDLGGVIVRSSEGVYIGSFANGHKVGQGKFIYPDGSIYEGGWKNDQKEGNGIILPHNGEKYDGEWESDCPHGTGTLKFKDGRIYKGVFKNGKIEGYGAMTFPNGDKYEGYWTNERRHGTGKYTWSNGQEYRGNFKNNVFDGYGTMKSPDGRIYKGSWGNSQREGNGSLTFPNGDEYEGSWVNDALQPKVTIKYSNGEKYQGEINVENLQKHGKGLLTLQNGDKYTGNWIDDVIQLNVKIEYSNGDRYKGNIENKFFRKQGKGTLKFNNGDQYDGDWINDKQEGQGKYCWKSTKCSFEADWKDGKMIGDGVMIFEDGTRLKAKWEKLEEGESHEKEENREMDQSQIEDNDVQRNE